MVFFLAYETVPNNDVVWRCSYTLTTFIILGKGLNGGFINVFSRRASLLFTRRGQNYLKNGKIFHQMVKPGTPSKSSSQLVNFPAVQP